MRKMMGLLALLLWLPLLSFGAPVRAQETGNWYFAYEPDGALVAFNGIGESNVLLDSGVMEIQRAWRVSAESALALVTRDSGTAMYHLSHDKAEEINWTGDSSLDPADMNPAFMVHRTDTFVVLVSYENPMTSQIIVVDLQALTWQLLEATAALPVRISADGMLLRYFSRIDDETAILREYTLASGEVRDVAIVHENLPLFSADTHGERWLYSQRTDEGRDYMILTLDGASEMLATFSRENPTGYQFFNEGLLSYSLLCEDECALTWQVEERSLSFPLPPLDSNTLYPLATVNEDELIVTISGSLWLLRADEAPQLLGETSPQHIFTPLQETISPDGRWLVALVNEDADPLEWQVWDLQVLETVAAGEGDFFIIRYHDSGFLLENSRQMTYHYYSAASGEGTAIAAEAGFRFVDILADGALLALQVRASEERAAGIYRYDVATQEAMLLVTNRVLVPLQARLVKFT